MQISVHRLVLRTCLQLLLAAAASVAPADDFDAFVKPLLRRNCVKCHGGDKVSGKVDLQSLTTAEDLLTKPKLIEDIIEVISSNAMPPEEEPQLKEDDRQRLRESLKQMLRVSASQAPVRRLPLRRLNRFQYNNAVRDLFQLNKDVFRLTEKLMTRHSGYLSTESGRMPSKVEVSCRSLETDGGFRNVNPYPRDLRAAHGFDNQANQLTLSPLLLDAFLKLSISILESPDFNSDTVGIWIDFFREPTDSPDLEAEVSRRLKPFLQQAFRGPVEAETLQRYTSYAVAKINQGLSFTESMKKTAAATLSSPLFLHRYQRAEADERAFELASNLSFFLWSSGPDDELLQLAAEGRLAESEVLQATIERMLRDPRIERFLDTFPPQWLQLENVLAATPDPQIYKLFHIDKARPASLQMVLEPLLLFDAVFLEDRPIVELIRPEFAYQSEFLRTWYTSDLKPPRADGAAILAENQRNEQRRVRLISEIERQRTELTALLQPVKDRLLASRRKDSEAQPPIDLKPYAAWEFDGDLHESVRGLDLAAHGDIRYSDGMVVLSQAYLLSPKLPVELKAKTLEVWCQLHDVNQRGGGVMGIQGPGDFFDTIVLGERKPGHWISGSNGFSRTEDFPDSKQEEESGQMLHLVMVYQEDGTTMLYRNGTPYGKPYRKGAAAFPAEQTAVIFGLRHLPPGGNKYLTLSLDCARLYDRALTADEVAASGSGHDLYVSEKELLAALTPQQKSRRNVLNQALDKLQKEFRNIPESVDPQQVQQELERNFEERMRQMVRSATFERIPAKDPRYGGVITSAAMLSMTSGPKRTHPIARGAWIIEVIFNDPPPPPPNDVPPLNEEQDAEHLTIREKFARHRENPDCAGCHSRLDPLGFALENFDIAGRWRVRYENGRDVDASGMLMKKYAFNGITDFKESLIQEKKRFASAFTAHLLRFALSRELAPTDSLTVDAIVDRTEADDFRIRSLIREVIMSDAFRRTR